MITIDSQIHGYRQGHQLLASTVELPKTDQALVDRLSDVAGPLGPGEAFAPYLSAYPLPSGKHYIFARTWQDLTVSRAGCVRTQSLVIPVLDWSTAASLDSFMKLLSSDTLPVNAQQFEVSISTPVPLAPAPEFQASELLEALFLEDPKPIALFDAPNPELIAIHLLSALWPSIRKRFSLSTFARAPRRIEGRDFDLLFVPKDARSKFADWPGRRIDGRVGPSARHRWTGAIVNRVFNQPNPRLLSDHEISIGESDESGTASSLRIALLWDELIEKLGRTPSAALGLLDIANSKISLDGVALESLKSALTNAAQQAASTLPASEAWEFIGAMARKMHASPMATEMLSVAQVAGELTERAPSGAIALLDQPDPLGAFNILIPAIARGLHKQYSDLSKQALLKAGTETIVKLLMADDGFAKKVSKESSLFTHLKESFSKLSPALRLRVSDPILSHFTEDYQFVIAQLFLASLNAEALIKEVLHLHQSNGFEATAFFEPLTVRARKIGAMNQLRDVLLTIPASAPRNQFLWSTLSPSVEDLVWLLSDTSIDAQLVETYMIDLLRMADAHQLNIIFNQGLVSDSILSKLPLEATDLLFKIILSDQIPLDLTIDAILKLLKVSDEKQKIELALIALDRCLRLHFRQNEVETIDLFLEIAEPVLNEKWVIKSGLDRTISASVMNRNLVAFLQSPKATRNRIIGAVNELAQALLNRYTLDLNVQGANACALILWEAHELNSSALLQATENLLPLLMRSKKNPISGMIAATFPSMYKHLAKADDLPDLLKFIPFLDLDRCKAARRELVDAFLSSSVWPPSDLALTAYRCSDAERILGRVANAYGGDAYLDQIQADLHLLSGHCRDQIERAISKVRSR